MTEVPTGPPHSAPISYEQELFSFATSVSVNEAVSSAPMIRFHAGATFSPLPLHTLCGRNVCVSQDRTVAVRSQEEYCNGYIFTSRPVVFDQKVVLQVGLKETGCVDVCVCVVVWGGGNTFAGG
jgi:hypothetical protein